MRLLRRSIYCSISLVLACVMFANCIHAELIIDINSISMSSRSTSFVDVFVSSRDNTPINVAGFDFTFEIVDISPIATPASGVLDFLNSFDKDRPSDPTRQSNSEQLFANYLFPGSLTSAENFAATRQDPTTTQLAVGDSTFSIDTFKYSNVQVTSSRLLARLEIGQRQTPETQIDRGLYQVRVRTGRFYQVQADDLSSPIDLTSYSFSPGFVTITAVPEPSSLALAILMACGVSWIRHRRSSSFAIK